MGILVIWRDCDAVKTGLYTRMDVALWAWLMMDVCDVDDEINGM